MCVCLRVSVCFFVCVCVSLCVCVCVCVSMLSVMYQPFTDMIGCTNVFIVHCMNVLKVTCMPMAVCLFDPSLWRYLQNEIPSTCVGNF